jgi:hypothetical protein
MVVAVVLLEFEVLKALLEAAATERLSLRGVV